MLEVSNLIKLIQIILPKKKKLMCHLHFYANLQDFWKFNTSGHSFHTFDFFVFPSHSRFDVF